MIYILVHAFLLFYFYLFVYYLFNIYFIIYSYLFIFSFTYLFIYLFTFIYLYDYSLLYLASTPDDITAVLKRVAETFWRKLKMTVPCSAIFVDFCIIGWHRIDILHFKFKRILQKWNDRVYFVFISFMLQAGRTL